jgi:two-component system, sensor histidine kinase
MPRLDALAMRRLEEALAPTERSMRSVLAAAGTAAIGVGFIPVVGWQAALAWFAIAVFFQNGGQEVLRRAHGRVSSRAWSYMALAVLFLSSFSAGLMAPLAALRGGVWGFANGEFLLACLVLFVARASGRSRLAFGVSITALMILFFVMPAIAWRQGAPFGQIFCMVTGSLFLTMTAGMLHRLQVGATQREQNAREKAEAATAAKSAFVAMVSHELRTPISGILAGAAELEKLPGDGQQHAHLISDSARMMRTLLNDLLDLSKMEAGRMSVEEIAFDLRAMVRDTVRFWAPEARKRGLRFRLQGSRSLPAWVEGDPTRLRQILNNLISNALKFTETGSITLRLGCADDALAFEVIDTGPGLSGDQIDRLFQAFDQLSASTARTHGGTGLGLNISRELARLMGGDLSAASAAGEGATFRLTLPLTLAAAPEVEDGDEGGMDVERGLRVLIVDDHSVNRQAFSLILQPVCEQVATAEDGLLALEALEQQSFDLVLLDLNMPNLGGLETARRLRANPGLNQRTPVIALTASVSPSEVDACLAAGMDAFVMKPVEARELIAAIDQVLATREDAALAA